MLKIGAGGSRKTQKLSAKFFSTIVLMAVLSTKILRVRRSQFSKPFVLKVERRPLKMLLHSARSCSLHVK